MNLFQEHFNIAYLAVIKQGKPAVNDLGNCVYRAPDGSKCALGHLIKDEDYKKEMDSNNGLDANSVIKDFELKDFDNSTNFYSCLQSCHDCAHDGDPDNFIIKFKQLMAFLARDFGLTIPEIPV